MLGASAETFHTDKSVSGKASFGCYCPAGLRFVEILVRAFSLC